MELLDLSQVLGFLAAAVLVTLSPGPDNLMVLSLGLSRGRRFGVAFGLGCALGCLSHTALAALGIGVLVAASPVLFAALKVAGGAYLVWLGVGALRSSGGLRLERGAGEGDGLARLFVRGLLANAINPKVVLFFLAFLPQFVDAGRGGAGWQMAQLGLIFTLQACLLFGAIGWSSGLLGEWLGRHGAVGKWLDRAAGAVFVGLGARLILDP